MCLSGAIDISLVLYTDNSDDSSWQRQGLELIPFKEGNQFLLINVYDDWHLVETVVVEHSVPCTGSYVYFWLYWGDGSFQVGTGDVVSDVTRLVRVDLDWNPLQRIRYLRMTNEGGSHIGVFMGMNIE